MTDYIALLISTELKYLDDEADRHLSGCSRVFNDEHELCKDMRYINVFDRKGKAYRITVQEL